MIAVVPKPVSVARPTLLMVATLTSLEIHFKFGELVISCVSGVVPLNVPMAMYCEVSPVEKTTCVLGMIVMAVRPFALELDTGRGAVPMTEAPLEDLPEAVMVAVPALTAVAMPLLFTVATPGALEAQVACVVRSWEAGMTPVYSPMATNFAVWPMTVTGWVDGTIVMEVRPVTGVAARLTCTLEVPCTCPKEPVMVAVMV